jgi:hypothetical protein
VKHAYTAADYAEQTLAIDTPAGSERLQMEVEYDEAVRDLVRTHGPPEYLHVVDRNDFYLFYTQRDLVVVIRRNLIPPGDVLKYERIPGHFLTLLPAAEIERIQARRASRRRAGPKARRRVTPAATPAAPAPSSRDTGLRLTDFDLHALIERFREPMSAADAGVSGWRVAALADGTRVGVARSGNTEYRIQPDAVIVATRISSRNRSTPATAKVGYYRVNRAVFGTRAHAISRSVGPLVARVAADPTGKTRFGRRIAGRTVSVTRDARRGLLVYQVHAD